MKYDPLQSRFETVVIGGGQAGLAAGYYLEGRDFVILDSEERIGDAWRGRWDTLRLFTPAARSALPGKSLPFAGGYYPTKDETADYLEDYAKEFELPVRCGRRVGSLSRRDERFIVDAGEERHVAENVIVATGPHHTPRVPEFAKQLDRSIFQIHSREYANPEQLPEGAVLVVGAGNSGVQISLDLAASRRVHLSGRDTGYIPAPVLKSRLFWRAAELIHADTYLGRRGREFERRSGVPVVGTKPRDLARAGIERVPRVESVVEGRPALSDGRTLEVSSVVWATGFRPDFRWIEPLILDEEGYPGQRCGAAKSVPGLYFLGLPFQRTFASATIGGVGEDARRVVEHLARRQSRDFAPESACR